MSRETYIPTEQPRSQAPARIPVAHGYQERSKSSCPPSCAWPEKAVGLSDVAPSASNEIIPHRVERLRVRREFLFVAKGHAERRRHVVVQARARAQNKETDTLSDASPNKSPHIGAGFTATKKIGSAVIRNRAKRRLRAAAAELLPLKGAPGSDYVFIARRDTASCAWRALLDDMESALISLRRKIDSGVAPDPTRKSPSKPRASGAKS